MECRNCGSVLTEANTYPSVRAEGQHICKNCFDERHERYRIAHRANYNGYMRSYLERVKLQVFQHYSPDLSCARCGFSADIRALTIDHINDDGASERRTFNHTGRVFYLSIRKRGFPAGYQVLCMNCQLIKELDRRERSHLQRERLIME